MGENDNLFQPTPEDSTIHIPITFDYKGGRGQNVKAKVIITIAYILFVILGSIVLFISKIDLLWKVVIWVAVFYILLLMYRVIILREIHISDVYEKLKKDDYKLDVTDLWQIFDIDYNYPYMCYFKNGKKGLFVKMERDAITGKPASARFDHFEAISDAYNIAHSLNMDIVHLDYMDSVGNDKRLDTLYEQLSFCENEDMRNALTAMYSHLEEEMSTNYVSYDVYLFTTRDLAYNFYENVREVCNTMLGGNFLTYQILSADEIGNVCKALYNLHEFSVNDACTAVLNNQLHKGIRPIRVEDLSGNVIKEINKTTAEERRIRQEQERLQQEREAQQRNARNNRNRVNAQTQTSQTSTPNTEEFEEVNTQAEVKQTQDSKDEVIEDIF